MQQGSVVYGPRRRIGVNQAGQSAHSKVQMRCKGPKSVSASSLYPRHCIFSRAGWVSMQLDVSTPAKQFPLFVFVFVEAVLALNWREVELVQQP